MLVTFKFLGLLKLAWGCLKTFPKHSIESIRWTEKVFYRPICSMIDKSREKKKARPKQNEHGRFYRIACSPFR